MKALATYLILISLQYIHKVCQSFVEAMAVCSAIGAECPPRSRLRGRIKLDGFAHSVYVHGVKDMRGIDEDYIHDSQQPFTRASEDLATYLAQVSRHMLCEQLPSSLIGIRLRAQRSGRLLSPFCWTFSHSSSICSGESYSSSKKGKYMVTHPWSIRIFFLLAGEETMIKEWIAATVLAIVIGRVQFAKSAGWQLALQWILIHSHNMGTSIYLARVV